MTLKACCSREARTSLARPRDVATCDECGKIILAYGNTRDFDSTIEELARHGVEFESAPADADFHLSVIAKARKRS